MCQRRQGVFEMNKIIIDGKEVEYEQGTTFEQIAKDHQQDYEQQIVLVCGTWVAVYGAFAFAV